MSKKILFYRNDWNANVNRRLLDSYGGVGYYRIINPSKFMKGHEVEVLGQKIQRKHESMEQRWNRVFKDYDIFWTTYFYNAEEASCMFYHRDKHKKKVVIDIDDDYLSILPTHVMYDVMKPTKKNRAICSTILSFADALTVSTEPLKQKLSAHIRKVHGIEKPIYVVPNMNDKSDWQYPKAEKHTDRIVVGYTGSDSHYDDLKMFLPHLAKIMDKYPNVYFESVGAVGHRNIELFSCFSESAKLRSELPGATWTFPEYPPYLSKMKWDIGVAPLADSEFTRSKSHIKWMEYAMYDIPTIASKVYPYFMPSFNRETINHGETGLLVQPSEWFDALEDLILNKEKREALGKNAHKFVDENWQYGEDFSDRLGEVVGGVAKI